MDLPTHNSTKGHANLKYLIKRKVYSSILEHLTRPEITMLVGPRQAGKTTLMLKLQKYIEDSGHPTLFLNLDIFDDFNFIKNQTQFINRLQNTFKNRKAYIFIDEIQRLSNAGIFLKGVYDKRLPYKFIISGSGSLELKQKIHESLAGRKLIFEVFPISFEEFLQFKTEYRYKTEELVDFLSLTPQKAKELLNEYLLFGGYPRVILEQDQNFKCQYLREIFQSYLIRDITEILKIEKSEKFSLLVNYLGLHIGNLINKTSLSQHLQLNYETLEKYLWYLEQTYIIKRVKPYFMNPKKELIKQPIYYFVDLGLRNYMVSQCHINVEQDDFLFQNFIFHLLYNLQPLKINYWRTKNKAEVDFIINMHGKIIPIEVKNIALKKVPALKGLKSFIQKYSPELAIIVNKSLNTNFSIGNTQVKILPYYEFLNFAKHI